jgi:hypothetical protein
MREAATRRRLRRKITSARGSNRSRIGYRGHRDTSLYEHGKDDLETTRHENETMRRVQQQYRDLAVAAVALSCRHTQPLIVVVTTSMHSVLVGRCGGG